MPRNTVLTQRQREQVMAFPHPDDARLIARSYLFSEQDIKQIQQQTSKAHQLFFALHLCVLRYPGRIWQINEQLPEYLVNLVARQLSLPATLLDGFKMIHICAVSNCAVCVSNLDFVFSMIPQNSCYEFG